MLHPYGINDAQPYGESVQETSISGSTVGIANEPEIRRLRADDRFFLSSPLDFGSKDTIVSVLDGDTSNKSFEIPLYRRAVTNVTHGSNPTDFNAYDVDSGSNANFSSAFGTFDFSNFKALMQAKKVISGSTAQSSILYRATKWGRSGEKITVSCTPAATLSNSVTVGQNISISLSVPVTTTATDLAAYVNTNLSDYISATVVSDGSIGVAGSGLITVSASGQLLDGINWISSSNLSGDPQFIFKKALSLQTDTGYAFNNGEEIRLIPTTMDQVKRLISISAVSGFSTIGNIGLVDRGTRLEISTSILGSLGAIQVIGGLANVYSTPVLDSAIRLDNTFAEVSVDKVSGQGIHSDQWFKLQAAIAQSKAGGLSSNSSVTITGNSPSANQSTVQLLGRTPTQRYFGKPRHHVRSKDDKFKVEKQGSLVCISWNGTTGSSPVFVKSSLNFNDAGGGALNVSLVTGTSEALYTLLSGNANFTELSIGDLITVAGMPNSVNNGTFLVTGVADNGKTIQVLNPSAANAFSHGSFTLTSQASDGDTFTVGSTILTARTLPTLSTEFLIGGTQALTAANLSATIGTIAGVTSSVLGSVVTVTGTVVGQTTALAHSGTGTVTLSGANIAGDTFVAGNFSASSGVSEGDTVVISSPFNVLNRETYRVIRKYNDSIWIENPNAVEEEVTLPLSSVNLGFDATTSFKVNATNNSAYLNWNGTGTEPLLGNANMGDVVTFGTDFSAANRGDFMVLRSGAKLQEITQLLMTNVALLPSGSSIGAYFDINSAGDLNLYRVWFQTGSNATPATGGRTLEVVNVSALVTDIQVASATASVITALTGMSATSSGNVATVTTTGFIETTDAAIGTMPSPFAITMVQQGRRTFLECINPAAVNQSSVAISTDILVCHRPQIQFSEYEASVAGDKFVATGTVLGSSNTGSYSILQVLSRDSAIITGSLSSVTNVSLNGNETAVFMQEGVPYSGYKHVVLSSAQPGAPTRNLIVLDTNAQYQKINGSSGVSMTSLNKLNFTTVVRNGLDSYRFNTGLIAEANRIVYGDPRDQITYPGVGAAGADIFVREPLDRRVQLSIDVRILTGVPFSQTVDQVRTSVGSLINSNPVGSPIAISAIVSVVNAIPGVRAVAISSPLYNAQNDLIFIAPGEKARIIDSSTDISVSSIG
jgi:hypothetical protein